jgi:hypothetical protein
MPLAQIGPFTSTLEAAATIVGAGILLGSFLFGGIALLRGASRQALERRVLTDGYLGGFIGVCVLVVDLGLR